MDKLFIQSCQQIEELKHHNSEMKNVLEAYIREDEDMKQVFSLFQSTGFKIMLLDKYFCSLSLLSMVYKIIQFQYGLQLPSSLFYYKK